MKNSFVNRETEFYVAGGNLMPGARSYVVRPADDELFESIKDGHYSYVLTSRQMGKSSLMHRTAIQLQEYGITPILLDLTSIGANLTVEQWYFGLLAEIGTQLAISEDMERYWKENQNHGPLYRFIHALDNIALAKSDATLAIFIDEIDFVRGLKNFSTDEFFAAIRQCYNARANNERMRRLTFCLLGVATPADLIRDVNTTPFNIGRQIELTDFTLDESQALASELDTDPKLANRKLERIFVWTNGHPYLTQKLCLALSQCPECSPGDVDRICHEMFLSSGVRRSEDNLIFAHNTLRNGSEDPAAVIGLYRKVLGGKRVPHDPSDPVLAQLRLAGVVRADRGRIHVRNKIYAQVFDRRWVDENMPDAALRREKAAFRRGAWRTAILFSSLLATILVIYKIYLINKSLEATNGMLHQERVITDKRLAIGNLSIAQRAIEDSNTPRAMQLLSECDDTTKKRFEWRYLWRLVHSENQVYQGSHGGVLAVGFLSQRNLVSIDSQGNVFLWNANNSENKFSYKINYLPTSAAFSKDGRYAASGDANGQIYLFNTKTGRRIREFTNHKSRITCISFASHSNKLISGSLDGCTTVWNTQTGREIEKISRKNDGVDCAVLSSDGRKIAIA
ncbi:MAG: GUN4-like family, partial [Capsulimonas sp.]|nr:GUN4-like family [Capsulimonas sp.]